MADFGGVAVGLVAEVESLREGVEVETDELGGRMEWAVLGVREETGVCLTGVCDLLAMACEKRAGRGEFRVGRELQGLGACNVVC